MRVPIRVKDDNSVGSLQVETQPTRPRTEDEHKVGGAWSVELFQLLLSVVCLGGTV